jgi:hypothetical protein
VGLLGRFGDCHVNGIVRYAAGMRNIYGQEW